jgi:dihydroxyacetone kinase-like predicted kinase
MLGLGIPDRPQLEQALQALEHIVQVPVYLEVPGTILEIIRHASSE